MSLVLNKLAGLLTTLVIVGVALFLSSAAEAHTGHGGDRVERAVVERVDVSRADVSAGLPGTLGAEDMVETEAASGYRDGSQHSEAASSCCGNGLSTCFSGILAIDASEIGPVPAGLLVEAVGFRSLTGITVDGLIRPPRAHV